MYATLAALLVLVVFRLRQSETSQRVAAIIDAADNGIIATSLDWVIATWNPAAERIYGYSGSEVVGRSAAFLFPADLVDDMQALKARLAAGEAVRDFETIRVRKDGSRIHVALTMSLIRRRRGVPSGALVIVRDLTAARRASAHLQALVSSLEGTRVRLAEAQSIAHVGSWELDCGSQSVVCSEEMHRIYETDPATFPATWEAFTDRVHRDDRAAVHAAFRPDSPADAVTHRILTPGGIKVVEQRWRFMRDAEGLPVRAIGTCQDVSARHDNEESLRQSADALRAFGLRVETIQASERAAIAREVHDAIGQGLTVLRMSASRLATICGANPVTTEVIARMTSVIDDTLKSTRSIAMALHPSALDDLGLAAAIEIHVAHVARSANFAAVVVTDPTPRNIPKLHAATAYRVLQECLTNVARHAQATEVKVKVVTTAAELLLEVSDNGRGFVTSGLAPSSSLGLLGMRERARILGGVLHVASSAGRGTSVSLRLPLP